MFISTVGCSRGSVEAAEAPGGHSILSSAALLRPDQVHLLAICGTYVIIVGLTSSTVPGGSYYH